MNEYEQNTKSSDVAPWMRLIPIYHLRQQRIALTIFFHFGYSTATSGNNPSIPLAAWHCSSPASMPTQQFGRVG